MRAIRTASSLELVFLVLVRYAYGFLDFLFTYKSALTMPLRSPALLLRGSSLLRADAPWISRSFPACAAKVSLHLLQIKLKCRPWFLCSLCFSLQRLTKPVLAAAAAPNIVPSGALTRERLIKSSRNIVCTAATAILFVLSRQ